jgi:molybdopterin-guanine dinucleotide biosynthesis protein A
VTHVTGLILAGGASRRMGRDKALLVFEGERLIDRAIQRLAPHCREVLVASGDGRRLDVPVMQIADDPAVEGPLAGLLAGLDAAGSADVAVVSVDAPFIDLAVLALCQRLRGAAPVAAPVVDGVVQPLHAVWDRSAALALRRAAAAGERSPRRLVTHLGGHLVSPTRWRPVAVHGDRFVRGWNRPEDLPDGVV